MSVKFGWTLKALSIGAAVVVALGVFGTSAASDEPDDASAVDGLDDNGHPTAEAILGNDKVLAVTEPLLALVNPNEGGQRVTADGTEYGYSGISVDPSALVVDVYWAGPVQPKAQHILDAAPADVTVRVHQSKYTLFEMLEAVENVVPTRVDGGSADLMITAAGPAIDGGGIWIEYIGTGSPEAIERAAVDAAGVDITSVEEGETLLGTARWNGYAPWEGGGGYWHPAGICSTSFPVTSNSTGAKHLLTAYHCIQYWQSLAVSNDTTLIGTAYTGSGYRHPEIDAALINLSTQSITPNIYYGSSGTSNVETIGAVGGNVVNAWACTDGANSGVHCLRVEKSNYTQFFPATGYNVKGLVRGYVPGSGNTAPTVGGDSGGPVVYPISGGKFRAMGTILGGTGSATCPPMRVPVTECAEKAIWVGTVTISATTNMTIATG